MPLPKKHQYYRQSDTPSVNLPQIFTLLAATCSVCQNLTGGSGTIEGVVGGRVVGGTAMVIFQGAKAGPLAHQLHSLDVYHRAECTIGFGYGKAHYYHFSIRLGFFWHRLGQGCWCEVYSRCTFLTYCVMSLNSVVLEFGHHPPPSFLYLRCMRHAYMYLV